MLQSWLNASMLCVRRAAARCVCVLTHTWQVCREQLLKLSQVDSQNDDGLRGTDCKTSCFSQVWGHEHEILSPQRSSSCDWLRMNQTALTQPFCSPVVVSLQTNVLHRSTLAVALTKCKCPSSPPLPPSPHSLSLSPSLSASLQLRG